LDGSYGHVVEWIITVVGRAGAVIDASRARMECIHPLRNDFGSIAVIAPVLRQSLWKPDVTQQPPPSASAQARA
jgi:hypothetical protein